MITPSHIIYNWALARTCKITGAAQRAFIVGGFLPDIPAYLFFFVHTCILGTAQNVMWDTLYFDSAWTPFITLSHSFLLWPTLVLCAYLLQKRVLIALALGSLFHSTLDFFVHHSDAYRHFWPLSNWTFQSPISYWEPAHFGTLFTAVDATVVLLLLYWIFYTTTQVRMRRFILLCMLLYATAVLLPLIIFSI